MKEHPLIFSAPMVYKTRDRLKTQARFVMRKQPIPYSVGNELSYMQPGDWAWPRKHPQCWTVSSKVNGPDNYVADESRWQPGDRFYVKETFYPAFRRTGTNNGCVYKADDNGRDLNPGWSPNGNGKGWRPSIHMPRWASRISRQIVAVRAERLQDISEADAKAEGIDQSLCAEIFDRAAGKIQTRPYCWIEDDDGGSAHSDNLCDLCAAKVKLRKNERIAGDGGCALESDGPAFCEKCGNPICMSLTVYGIERELFLECNDVEDRPRWSAHGSDARIVADIASGMGDLRAEHLGRLAQIGYATLWDSINGKTPGKAWADNPWVWVIEWRNDGADER